MPVRDPRALTADEHGRSPTCCARANMVDLREPAHRARQGPAAARWRASSASSASTTTGSPTTTASAASPSRGERGPRRLHSVHRPADPLAHRRLLQPAGPPHPGDGAALRRERPRPAARTRCSTTRSPTCCCATPIPRSCAALMRPDAMTIPARTDDAGVVAARGDRPGLLRRPGRRRAAHALHRAHAQHRMEGRPGGARGRGGDSSVLLAGPSPYIHRLTLQPGMGLLCNNVLHDRTGFTDDPGAAAPDLPGALPRPHTDRPLTGAGAPQRRRRPRVAPPQPHFSPREDRQ